MELSLDRMLGIFGVLGIVIGVGVAIAMDPKVKSEMQFAIGCFIFSGIALCLTVGIWAFSANMSAAIRVLVTGILCAVTCASMVEASRWANGRFQRASSQAQVEARPAQTAEQNQPTLAPAPAPSRELSKSKEPHTLNVEPPKPLSGRGFHETVQKYFFSLGNGISASATVEGLKAGIKPFEGFPIRVFAQDSDNDIHYEITVWRGTRALVVKDNEFSLSVPHLDRNYDDSALEIVDDEQGPILQVIWKTSSELVINGIFPMQGGGVSIVDNQGMRPWKGEKIKPLFKYPSRRFRGQYADEN